MEQMHIKNKRPKCHIKNKGPKWHIMSAYAWIKGKPSIEKIIKENDSEATIMVVKRDDVKTFILGSRDNYGEIGKSVRYIQDTGNGYGRKGFCEIENIIKIDKEKIVDSGNGIGVNEKRTLWVFK